MTNPIPPKFPSLPSRRTQWLPALGGVLVVVAASFTAVLLTVSAYAFVVAIADGGVVDADAVGVFADATGDRLGPALRVLVTFLVARHLAGAGRLARLGAVAFAAAVIAFEVAIGAAFGDTPTAIDAALGIVTLGAAIAGQRLGEQDHVRLAGERALAAQLRDARTIGHVVAAVGAHLRGEPFDLWAVGAARLWLAGTDRPHGAATPAGDGAVACGGAHAITLRRDAPAARRQLLAVADPIGLALERIALQAAARQQGAREERERLAGDIHDTIAQDLGGAAAHLEAATVALPTPEAAAGRHLRVAGDSVRSALGELRGLVWALRPEERRLPLAEALRRAIDRVATGGDLRVQVDLPDDVPRLVPDAELCLLRALQEGMHNTRRHAQATRCEVRLAVEHDAVVLTVADDGIGLPAGGVAAPAIDGGHGLSLLRDRAARLGGRLETEATAGGGTRLTLRLPRVVQS